MWTLYDRLIEKADNCDRIALAVQGDNWTLVKTQAGRLGVAAVHPTRSGKKLDCAQCADDQQLVCSCGYKPLLQGEQSSHPSILGCLSRLPDGEN